MSLVIAAVVIYGFSHTINENLIHPAYPRPREYHRRLMFLATCALTIAAFNRFPASIVPDNSLTKQPEWMVIARRIIG